MPTSEEVLGFSNQWYEIVLVSAIEHELADGVSIPVAAAPPFIGAKIEAFRNRGDNDYYASPDLEDIVTVLNGRPEIVEEFGSTSNALLSYVAAAFEDWLRNRTFKNALPGHLPHTKPGADRTDIVKNRMTGIIEQSELRND